MTRFRGTAWVAAGMAAVLSPFSTARAAESKAAGIMPAAQENAIVQKYCGSCHSDSLMYGGMSVQHFDAAHAAPSEASMLVSKLTGGHTPEEVIAAGAGARADATILGLMKKGAMGAGGIGVPDEPTQLAFVRSLSAQASGAGDWDARTREDAPANPRTLTANIVRALPSTKFAPATDMYRLMLTCKESTREGEIRLLWANGVPEEGQEIAVEADGRTFTHKVTGGKQQGNGKYGPGATILYPAADMRMTLPARSLTVSGLFPNETVEFPLDQLSQTTREELSACFGGSSRAH